MEIFCLGNFHLAFILRSVLEKKSIKRNRCSNVLADEIRLLLVVTTWNVYQNSSVVHVISLLYVTGKCICVVACEVPWRYSFYNTTDENNSRYVSSNIMAGKAVLNVATGGLDASITNNTLYRLGLIPGSARSSHHFVQTGSGTPVDVNRMDSTPFCTRVIFWPWTDMSTHVYQHWRITSHAQLRTVRRTVHNYSCYPWRITKVNRWTSASSQKKHNCDQDMVIHKCSLLYPAIHCLSTKCKL
jgi:hypothetical protein